MSASLPRCGPDATRGPRDGWRNEVGRHDPAAQGLPEMRAGQRRDAGARLFLAGMDAARLRRLRFRLSRESARLRRAGGGFRLGAQPRRSEEHTSELQSLMRISYAVFCLKKKKQIRQKHGITTYK